MAVLCSHCGQPLKKDTGRFCQNCGTRIPTLPLSPQSLGREQEASPSEQWANDQSLPREQITPQPQARHDGPPEWMSRLSKPARDERSLRSGNFVPLSRFSATKPVEPPALADAVPQSVTPPETSPDQPAETAIARPEPIAHTHIAAAGSVAQEQHERASVQENFLRSPLFPRCPRLCGNCV